MEQKWWSMISRLDPKHHCSFHHAASGEYFVLKGTSDVVFPSLVPVSNHLCSQIFMFTVKIIIALLDEGDAEPWSHMIESCIHYFRFHSIGLKGILSKPLPHSYTERQCCYCLCGDNWAKGHKIGMKSPPKLVGSTKGLWSYADSWGNIFINRRKKRKGVSQMLSVPALT